MKEHLILGAITVGAILLAPFLILILLLVWIDLVDILRLLLDLIR